MDLTLFGVFLALSLVLIGLGLFVREHTELSLIGFVLMFLLSTVVLNNDIQYKIGTNTTSNFTYTADYFNDNTNITLLTSSEEQVIDIYGTSTLGGTLSHTVGYWLSILSVIGFVGVFLSLKHSKGWQ